MITRISRGNIFRRKGFVLASLVLFLALSDPARAAEADADAARPPSLSDSSAEGRRAAVDLERALVREGLENVRVAVRGDTLLSAYENRRYRQSAEALDLWTRGLGRPWVAFERRAGLVAAAIRIDSTTRQGPSRLRYPSDRDFPLRPIGPALASTRRSVDLEIGPLVTYEIGHIFDPFQLRVDLQPRLRYNPWSGGLATLAWVIPLQNDFAPGDLDPDINRVRPGPLKLDQFAFIPGAALLSGSLGYFGDNRYGLSIGAARPIAGGRLLVDAQWDQTGFIAFPRGGTIYSNPSHWSGFAGLTWRPSFAEIAVRARAARFLYGDHGGELEVLRTMGDFEVGGFIARSTGVELYGVRVDIPVPPLKRATGARVRVQPVERFPLEFRSTSEPVATWLGGVASRTDFLRQLNEPGLDQILDRYRGSGSNRAHESAEEPQWISWSGMTGFVHTPWAGVLRDRDIAVGFRRVPRRWAYDHRGSNDNEIYYATLGFLPHVEASMRWTRIPGYHSFEEIAPDSRLTDIDRMVSGRLELLAPRERRPGLALGVEDAEGTRRFHSTYVVAGVPAGIQQVHSRVSLGYGLRTFRAGRRVLDGSFGAFEVSAWRRLVGQIEFDSEKWNAAVGVEPGFGFQLRAAWLNLESPSLAIGWSHPL